MHRRNRFIFIGVTTIFLLLGGLLTLRNILVKLNEMNETPLRRELPRTATDIREYVWDEPGVISQDWCYMLKARMSYAEFTGYAARLQLMPASRKRMGSCAVPFHADREEDLSWWNPSATDTNVFAYPTKNSEMAILAKYENGYAFVMSSGW